MLCLKEPSSLADMRLALGRMKEGDGKRGMSLDTGVVVVPWLGVSATDDDEDAAEALRLEKNFSQRSNRLDIVKNLVCDVLLRDRCGSEDFGKRSSVFSSR